MRSSLVVLALATLAAAGPLPPTTNTSLEASAPTSVSTNLTLPSDCLAALTELKAVYDSHNQKRTTESGVVAKRGLWHDFGQFIKNTFEAPGLGARSLHERNITVSSQISANIALPSDAIAALTKAKAFCGSLNLKATEDDFIARLKAAFEASGLHARSSSDDHNCTDGNPDDTFNSNLTRVGLSGSTEPILP